MKRTHFVVLFSVLFLCSACSVISKDIRKEAAPEIPFELLMDDITSQVGKTILLGGYILETKNFKNHTRIKALQTPLGMMDEPRSKDRSGGRFIVVEKGFVDPEVFRKGRRITVAGKVLGKAVEKVDGYDYPYLELESRELYLWSEKTEDYYRPGYYHHSPYWYYHPYVWRHPYWW